ncbi:MAG: hypothetical protein WCA13_03280 [Terriglobales bacterium]
MRPRNKAIGLNAGKRKGNEEINVKLVRTQSYFPAIDSTINFRSISSNLIFRASGAHTSTTGRIRLYFILSICPVDLPHIVVNIEPPSKNAGT